MIFYNVLFYCILLTDDQSVYIDDNYNEKFSHKFINFINSFKLQQFRNLF